SRPVALSIARPTAGILASRSGWLRSVVTHVKSFQGHAATGGQSHAPQCSGREGGRSLHVPQMRDTAQWARTNSVVSYPQHAETTSYLLALTRPPVAQLQPR